jgi:hypothetical protein
MSHEKVNSGFIYGLRLAYPQEKMMFYADISHIRTIKEILTHDNTIIKNIEYIPIKFRGSYGIVGMLTYYFLFKKMFSDVLANGTDKIFFLSFSPTILNIIKKLKQKNDFIKMKFALVLHGDFENIADGSEKNTITFPADKPLIERIRQTKFRDLPRKIAGGLIGVIRNYIITLNTRWQSIFTKLYPIKKMLLWRHSADFRYIALSPHIVANAEKYIDVKELNIYTVVYPNVFSEPTPQPDNKYPKFATFGYGNPSMLHNVALRLSQKDIKKPYEIRIIGMDNRGTEGFSNVTCPSPGKPLARSEMEKYAQDIDVFLILYEKNRHRFGCSGSIIESLSYMKPVLHFNNDCINTFNKQDKPIGIRCETIEEFVNTMEDIIENYQSYIPKFQTFRNNILNLRKEIAIENSITQIRDTFTWSPVL